MKRLFPLTSVTTASVAFAALCGLKNPWGVAFANGESRLDFEPGHKYGPALSGDG
jgi:hypothetical protein